MKKMFQAFQKYLNEICKWSNKWQLHFNAKTCIVMHRGRKNNENNFNMIDKVGNVTSFLKKKIEKIKEFMCIINELKFHDHVNNEYGKKKNQYLGRHKVKLQNFEPKIVCQLYETFGRLILEYGNSVWCPRFIKRRCCFRKSSNKS